MHPDDDIGPEFEDWLEKFRNHSGGSPDKFYVSEAGLAHIAEAAARVDTDPSNMTLEEISSYVVENAAAQREALLSGNPLRVLGVAAETAKMYQRLIAALPVALTDKQKQVAFIQAVFAASQKDPPMNTYTLSRDGQHFVIVARSGADAVEALCGVFGETYLRRPILNRDRSVTPASKEHYTHISTAPGGGKPGVTEIGEDGIPIIAAESSGWSEDVDPKKLEAIHKGIAAARPQTDWVEIELDDNGDPLQEVVDIEPGLLGEGS